MNGFWGKGWRGPRPPIGVPFGLNTQSPQAQGLVAWWPGLGSAGANILRDFSGRGLHGVFPGGTANPAWAGDAQFGQTLSFNGVNNYVDCGNAASLNITNALTIGTWINPTVSGNSKYRTILAKRIGTISNYQLYLYGEATNQGILNFYATSNINTGYIPVVGNYTHIVATVLETNVSVYANGRPIATGSSAIATNNGILAIGRVGSNEVVDPDLSFFGFINDTRIYNRALSAAEVWQQYDPATRWDLYRPLTRRWWIPAGAAVTVQPVSNAVFQKPFANLFRGIAG